MIFFYYRGKKTKFTIYRCISKIEIINCMNFKRHSRKKLIITLRRNVIRILTPRCSKIKKLHAEFNTDACTRARTHIYMHKHTYTPRDKRKSVKLRKISTTSANIFYRCRFTVALSGFTYYLYEYFWRFNNNRQNATNFIFGFI